MTSADEAEIRTASGWRRIAIAETLSEPRGAEMCCRNCGGRVRTHREGTAAQRAHFERYQRHTGCSTKPGFKGPATRHPHIVS